MSEQRSVAMTIRGRVQGVGYRAWTRARAEALGLSGTVRNRLDGSVEARLRGPAEAVAAMIEACRRGPPGARVEEVAVAETGEAETGAASGIRILPSA